MSSHESGATAQKRPYGEEHHHGGVGHGAGRPSGATPGLAETLASLQAQLTLQTTQLGKVAEKEDVLGLSDKVDTLAADVHGHGSEIDKIRRLPPRIKSATRSDLPSLRGRSSCSRMPVCAHQGDSAGIATSVSATTHVAILYASGP